MTHSLGYTYVNRTQCQPDKMSNHVKIFTKIYPQLFFLMKTTRQKA